MSLNGLDDVKLKEAHDVAVAEPGGWFLLKYISRDEVELLGKGNGGIVEIRNAIASYEEPSPLFGFLRYRRRNVLIKYVPEDCSRLVQARVAVHFNAVTERFSPYDTDFAIATAKELRDTTLSAACSLHTASGSTSSSTSSLRRRRLMEIAEDAEEDNRKRQSTVLEERPGTAKSAKSIGKTAPIVEPSSATPPAPSNTDDGLIPLTLPNPHSFKSTKNDLETSPPPPRERFELESKSPPKPTDEPQSRKSSQLTRPELNSYNTYSTGTRPRIKLGPRPSLDVSSSRPHTSGAASHYRPVSTLPIGLKIFGKGSRQRPTSTYNTDAPSTIIPPPPIPDSMSENYQNSTPVRPHTSGGRPPPKENVPMNPLISPTSTKMPSITPEKARLMKALEMRKKKSASAAAEPTSPSVPHNLINTPQHETRQVSNAIQGAPDTLTAQNNLAKDDDSAIAFDANSAMKIDESDATKSDSYPVSPTAQSERAESTSASSLSESADGTLQVTDAEKNASRGSKSNNPSSSQPDSTPAESYVAGTTGGDLGADNASVPTQAATAEKLQTEFVEAQLHSLAPAEVEKVEDGNSGLSHNVLAEDFPTESVSAPAPAHSTPAQAATNVNSEKSPITLQPNESQNTITPIEPAKVDKHVTFDESEDHVIPDTSMRDDDATNSEYSVPAEDDTVHEVVEENAVVKDAPEPVQIIAEPVTEATTMVKTDNVVPERTPEAVPAVEQASAIDVSEINEQTSALTEQAPKVSEESAVAKPAEVEKASEPAAESTLIAKLDKKGEAPNSTSELEDTKATATIAPIVTELHAASDTKPSVVVTPKSPVGSTFSVDSRPTVSGDDRPRGDKSATKKKKRGLEPIRTDIEVPDRRNADDANLSSDDEFMDELQSAVMQEAKPISVSKSPISPMFPTPKKADSWRNKFSRAASNPMKKSEPESQLLTPPKSENPTPTRSVSSSAAYLKKISQEASKPAPTKKVNVGSGIAARMKAFEKFSSGPSTPPVSTGPPPGSTPAFFSVRKASNRVPSRSPGPSVAERANSITRNTPPPESRDSSPETRRTRERSSSIKNRLSSFEPDTVPTPQPTSRPRPESISVTARIIRDPSQPYPSQAELKKDPSEYAPLDLKQSPLVIDHQRAVTAKETIQQRRQSKERRLSNSSDATNTTVKNRRSSVTIVKDLINERRASFAERRRSINLDPNNSSTNLRNTSRPPSMKSPSRPPSTHTSPVHTRSQSITSRLSSSSNRDMNDGYMSPSPSGDLSSSEDKASKKSNRASRMLRRMSSSLSSGRKALAHAVSPTVREESEPGNSAQPLSPQSGPSTPNINIGDVNVQFPDSLLWKRRSMMLDSQGFLILSPALTASGNGKAAAGGATRRFHLSDFRRPVIPDMEMEELPNSVLLDFDVGGGLQIACEDRAGQSRVLEVLQDAHQSVGQSQ